MKIRFEGFRCVAVEILFVFFAVFSFVRIADAFTESLQDRAREIQESLFAGEYRASIQSLVEDMVLDSELNDLLGLEGSAAIHLVLSAEGEMEDIFISESNLSLDINQKIVQGVLGLSPFMPFPVGISDREILEMEIIVTAGIAVEEEEEEEEEVFLEKESFLPVDEYGVSLEECVETALLNNRPAKIAVKEIRLAQMKIAEAKRALFPKVNIKWEETKSTLSGGVVDSVGRRMDTELQQPIYHGGALKAAVRQAQENYITENHKYEKIKNDLVFEVEKAYFPLVVAKSNLEMYRSLKDESRNILSIARKRYEVGLSTPVEIMKIENLSNQIEHRIISLKEDISLAKLTLQHTLNVDYEIDVLLGELGLSAVNIEEVEVEKYLDFASFNRPDIKMNESLVESSRHGLYIARGRMKPRIDLTTFYGTGAENFETEDLVFQKQWYMGLEVNVPWGVNLLKNSTITQDKVAQAGQVDSTKFTSNTLQLSLFEPEIMKSVSDRNSAQIAYEKAISELLKSEQAVAYDVIDSTANLHKAEIKLAASRQKVELDEKELIILKHQSELNEVLYSRLFEQMLQWGTDKSGYNQALGDYRLAFAKLDWAVGMANGFFDEEFEDIDIEATAIAWR